MHNQYFGQKLGVNFLKKKKNTVGNIWDGTIYEQWTFYSDVMSFDQIEEPNFFFTQIGSPLLFN